MPVPSSSSSSSFSHPPPPFFCRSVNPTERRKCPSEGYISRPCPPCFVPSSAPSLVPCAPNPVSRPPRPPPSVLLLHRPLSNARDSEVTQKIFDGRETLGEVTSTTAVFIVTRAIDHRSVSWNNGGARALSLVSQI